MSTVRTNALQTTDELFNVPINALVRGVGTINLLKAILTPWNGMIVHVTDPGVGGVFRFDNAGTGGGDSGTTFPADDLTAGLWRRNIVGDWQATWWGVIGDGTTNNTTALSNAILAADGRKLVLPNGVIKVDGTVEPVVDSAYLKGQGDETVLDFSGGGRLYLRRTPTALPGLSANIVKGQDVVTFATAHGLVRGDVFMVYNPSDSSFSSARTYYRDGCMFAVADVVSTTQIRIYGVAPAAFSSAAFWCYKVIGQGVRLESFRSVPAPTGINIWIDGHHRVRVSDLNLNDGAADTFLEIYRSFDVRIENMDGYISAGNGYSVIVANCQRVLATKIGSHSNRHSIAFGGRSEIGAVPTRDVVISHSNLSNSQLLGIGASDIHGNCENIRYVDCFMNASANIGGRNVSYENCVIMNRSPVHYADGNVVYGSELCGGTVRFDGCRFVSTGTNSTFGMVHLGMEFLNSAIYIAVKNCVFEAETATSTTVRFVTVVSGDGAYPAQDIFVDIQGCTFILAGGPPNSIFNLSGTADINTRLKLIIDDITAPSGTPLFGASNAANYACAQRMPRQYGKEELTSSATTLMLSGFNTFRYAYARTPVCSVNVSGRDGVILGLLGGQVPVPTVYTTDKTRVRIGIHSAAGVNFTASVDYDAHWVACIAEI